MGVGFGDRVLYVPVEAGFEGLADVAVDDGASDTESASELGDVTVLKVWFAGEVGDEGEVAFGVSKEFGEGGVVGEGGVFGVENVV